MVDIDKLVKTLKADYDLCCDLSEPLKKEGKSRSRMYQDLMQERITLNRVLSMLEDPAFLDENYNLLCDKKEA